jgi:hypothetical protein
VDARPTARSRTGAIAVSTTENGLPIALRIDASEMRKAPQVLADEIFALCRLAAVRAQVARRRELAAAQVDPQVLRDLGLATEEDLVRAEDAARTGDDVLPPTWMRSL